MRLPITSTRRLIGTRRKSTWRIAHVAVHLPVLAHRSIPWTVAAFVLVIGTQQSRLVYAVVHKPTKQQKIQNTLLSKSRRLLRTKSKVSHGSNEPCTF